MDCVCISSQFPVSINKPAPVDKSEDPLKSAPEGKEAGWSCLSIYYDSWIYTHRERPNNEVYLALSVPLFTSTISAASESRKQHHLFVNHI